MAQSRKGQVNNMKKIITLLCMITSILCLSGCGQEKQTLNYDAEMIKQVAYAVGATSVAPYLEEDLADMNSWSARDWEKVEKDFEAQGIYCRGEVLLAGIEGYNKSKEDIGDLLNEELEPELKIGTHDIIATIPIDGSKHDAEIVVLFDENIEIVSVSTNVSYTFGEQMGKAGLNTLLGMGSVFAILVLIMFIIGLFKYIAVFENKIKNKAVATADVDTKAIETVDTSVDTSEFEVVAAIAAAIAASEGATSTDGFVVRSIKKRR